MTLRVRTHPLVWLVIGALLAATTIIGLDRSIAVDAAPGDLDSTYVPVAPCRAFDYRPGANNVGTRNTALGEGEVHIQQITGSVGNCVGASALPSTAVGVALNVTIVAPTAQSNLRLYPADVDTPLVSNLNWLAGQSPTPNKVDVKLSPSGAIKVENFKGSVFVVGDVVGYYTTSSLTELAGDVNALQQQVVSLEQRLTEAEDSVPFAVEKREPTGTIPEPGFDTLAEVGVTAPVDGFVVVNSVLTVSSSPAGTIVSCSLTDGTTQDADYEQYWTSPNVPFRGGQLTGLRRFSINAGEQATYRLVCSILFGDTSSATDIVLTATFTPAA